MKGVNTSSLSEYARARRLLLPYLDGAALVLPTGDFFPDDFDATPESITHLLDRIRAYTPLAEDVGLHLAFVTPDDVAGSGGSCSSGGCGTGGGGGGAMSTRVVPHANGYGFALDVRWGSSPIGLVAELTRATLGAVALELDEKAPRDDDREMLAAACGFGVLLLEASCVYKKGCHGVSASRATHFQTADLALVTAAHLRVIEASPSDARRHLSATQREAFAEALAWVDSRPSLIEKLREAPELVEMGIPEAEPTRGFLSRLFG